LLRAIRSEQTSLARDRDVDVRAVAVGPRFHHAFSAIIACINNIGPGLGTVGPSTNYASLTDFQSWVCAVAMILGRLEIFPVVVLMTRAFWRK
jgi:trk system potassium uptake protein